MSISQLIYCSEVAEGVTVDMVLGIRRSAAEHNEVQGISGCLAHSPRYFLQLIEGGAEPINRLYNRILRDERHTRVTLLSYSMAPERVFPGWGMHFCSLGGEDKTFFRFSSTRAFDPFDLSPGNARALLTTLSQRSR